MRRSVVAAEIGLLAAFVIAALLGLIFKLPLAELASGDMPMMALGQALLPIASFALPFAAAAILLSEARRVRGLPYWVFVGALIGVLGFVALSGGAPATRAAYQNMRTLFALLSMGAAGGFIYWWAAGRHAGRVAQSLAHVRSGALNEEQGRRHCWRCALALMLMSLVPLALLGWYGIYRPDPMLGQKLVNRAEADASALLAKSGVAALSLKIADHVGHVMGQAANADERLKVFDTAKSALAPLVGLPGVVSYLENNISVPEAAPVVAEIAVNAEEAAKRQAEADAAAKIAAQKVAEAAAASKAATEAGQAAADAAKRKSDEIMRAAEQAAKEKAAADQREAERLEAKRKAEAETRAAAEALAREEAARERAVAEAAAAMAEVKRLAQERVKADADAAAKRAEEERARGAAQEQLRAEAETARLAAEADAKKKADEQARAEAEAELKRKAEEQARATADAAQKAEAERVARAQAEAARLAAELEAKRQAEQAEQAREAERIANEQQLEDARRKAEAEAEHKAVEAAHAQQAADEAVKAAAAKAVLANAEPSQQSCAAAYSDLFRSQTIRFDAKSAIIRRADKPFIKTLATTAKTCAGFTLSIDGHSDRRGDGAENEALSLARARAVRSALIARGVAPERLKAAGYGAERPFDPGNTKAAYALNRRIDFGASYGVAKAAAAPIAPKERPAARPVALVRPDIAPADCGGEFARVFLADTVRFRGASARVSPTYSSYLDRLAGVLAACETYKLAIGGHTDRRGSAAANQALSEARAANVKAALVARGIRSERLATAGYGGQRPFDPGDSRDALALNRRVDFGVKDTGK